MFVVRKLNVLVQANFFQNLVSCEIVSHTIAHHFNHLHLLLYLFDPNPCLLWQALVSGGPSYRSCSHFILLNFNTKIEKYLSKSIQEWSA